MNIRMKQRLAGGVLLVFILIVCLPLVFHHKNPEEQVSVTSQIPGAPDKASTSNTELPILTTIGAVEKKPDTQEQTPVVTDKSDGAAPETVEAPVVIQGSSAQEPIAQEQPQALVATSAAPVSLATSVLQATQVAQATPTKPDAHPVLAVAQTSQSEPQPEQKPKPKPKPKLESKTIPVKKNPHLQQPKSKSKPEPKLKPKSKPESNPKSKSKSKSDLSPESKIDSTSKQKTKEIQVSQQTEKWTIQLASFNDHVNADKLVQTLRQQGFQAHTQETKNAKGTQITRVYVGPENNQAQALKLREALKKQLNLEGVVKRGIA